MSETICEGQSPCSSMWVLGLVAKPFSHNKNEPSALEDKVSHGTRSTQILQDQQAPEGLL